MEYIGWIGSILLALCGFPQAVKSYRDKNADGISSWFLAMWFFGEVFVLMYIFPEKQYPLIANYSANIVFVLIIIWYKLYPKRNP